MTEPFKMHDLNALAAHPIADHAQAFIELLQQAIDRLERNEGVPEVAGDLLLPIRIAARKV